MKKSSLSYFVIVVVLPVAWHLMAKAVLGCQDAFVRRFVDLDSIQETMARSIEPADYFTLPAYWDLVLSQFSWQILVFWLPAIWFLLAAGIWILSRSWSKLFPGIKNR